MQKKWTLILGVIGLIIGLLHPANVDFGVAMPEALGFAFTWAIFFGLIGLIIDYFAVSGKSLFGLPSPKTHVKCPDCRELVLRDARKCKHCGCALVPQ